MSATLAPPPVPTTVGNYFVSNYPPFSTWRSDYIPNLIHVLAGTPKPGPMGLYVHLPFCRQRCHYCYFRVYPRREPADVDLYIGALLKELSLYRNFPVVHEGSFSSVYFGGGSPTYLSAEQMRRLLGGLRVQSDWESVEECTFECEPGSVTPEKLQSLKELGVTRLSLGFQTLNNELLRRCGRDVTVKDCLKSFQLAREAGFDEINIDLLAGVPDETAKSWRRTIDQVLELTPECVTIYQMELTHNSRLHSSMQTGRAVSLPSWPEKRQLVGEAFRQCEEAGYVIGSGYMAIRNPDRWRFVYTVKNFWHGGDLLALGETSFGHLQGVHYQNVDTFDHYLERLQQDKIPLRRAYRLNAEERLRREVILHFKTGALDAAYFRKKFDVDLVDHFEPQFEQLLLAGLLQIEGDDIRLTREGLLQVDWLLPAFYLPEHRGLRYT